MICDRWGRYPEFVEHFHKLLARSQNELRGRWENFWSSEQVCVVKLVDRAAVIDKLVYTATNPVLDHLVDRGHHWPGVFRPDGSMPEVVELRLTIPSELGPEAALLAELRDRVRAVEAEQEAARRRSGGRVVGRRGVLTQSWRGQPASREPRRNLRPRVASRSKWARIEALLRNRAFVADYLSARSRWRQGEPTLFPPGTYWFRRFAYVPVAET